MKYKDFQIWTHVRGDGRFHFSYRGKKYAYSSMSSFESRYQARQHAKRSIDYLLAGNMTLRTSLESGKI